MSRTPNFEKSMQELEALVKQLETGELTLEESLKHYEKGMKLTRICQEALTQAEQKIEYLTTHHTADTPDEQ